MLVKDIMTTNVITISEDKTMLEAQELMKSQNIRRVPVVDDIKRVLGIITDGDVGHAAGAGEDQRASRAVEVELSLRARALGDGERAEAVDGAAGPVQEPRALVADDQRIDLQRPAVQVEPPRRRRAAPQHEFAGAEQATYVEVHDPGGDVAVALGVAEIDPGG